MDRISISPRQHQEFMAAFRRAKLKLSLVIGEAFNGVVQEGPLTGLKMTGEASWGGSDAASMLLGIYEQQLFPFLTGHKHATIINVGAADGFWAVGLVQGGHFDRAICFESRAQGQANILKLAILNGVQGKIFIHGEANVNFAKILSDEQIKGNPLVILIDIEGAEYDLLTEEILAAMANCMVIVELHPRATDDIQADEKLIRRASQHFTIETLDDTSKDLSAISKYLDVPDHLRYILVSEQRRYCQQWLVLKPIKK